MAKKPQPRDKKPAKRRAIRTVSVDKFGKDHWALLGYIETCCVEPRENKVNHDNMRTNPNRNLELGFHKSRLGTEMKWKDEYSTRLRTFPWKSTSKTEKAKHRVAGHDDWDCLKDLERAGLARLISYVNGFVQITDAGLAIAAEMRAHKAKGGYFSNFTPKMIPNPANCDGE